VVLENANLCASSVLDRLNSLCESDGILTLSERGPVSGMIEKITPHPNFRLFMTLNPQYGELSRAMRNRGVELSFDHLESHNRESSDFPQIHQALRSRGLESAYSGLGVYPMIGNDSLTEVTLLQSSTLMQFPATWHDDAQALATWLLQSTPAALFPQVARLWATLAEFVQSHAVFTVINESRLLDPERLLPQLSFHQSTLVSERNISKEWLRWQVRL
jgi:hypothetical protein